ncbi:SDR family oxidoreductase [Marinilabilia rubra]|uniref:D-mannonate oxidoreductase n=1 Tax=Marinilabilia rubra TaxID=2162893 RepID=A0A2U2B6Q5_9BACT|nr:SDR family oxidoreductase [Marinilabilia rubra]PWD98736.1 D-mannonate oxidoreductase [Marinilabilia rubra]
MTIPVKELNLRDKVAVITGGSGVIGSFMAAAMAKHGIRTAIIGRNKEKAENTAREITANHSTPCIGISADVMDKESLAEAKVRINRELGSIDYLINGAGGNSPLATSKVEMIEKGSPDDLEGTFFGLKMDGFNQTFDINFQGTLLPTMIFAKDMLEKERGSIVNISSMNSYRPLTKIPAYSAAKAAINNFTQWLSVHFAKTGIRVNAIAPGFLLTDQNRFLLIDEKTGKPTERGQKIINSTPMGRYCNPDEVTGTLLFLLSDWAEFTTGVVIPVDGGFSAYSGV